MCDIYPPLFVYYSYISVFFLSMITALVILLKDRKNCINRNAFIFIVIIALWVLDDFAQWNIKDAKLNLMFARFSGFIDAMFLFFLYFSYYFSRTPISLKKKIIFAVPFFILIPFYFTDYFIRMENSDPCNFIDGPLNFLSYSLDLFYVIWASVILIRAYMDPNRYYLMKYQIRILLSAIWFLVLASITYQAMANMNVPANSIIDISAYFIISNLIFVSLVAFAIIKYDLFEFDSVLNKWSVIFIWSIIFLGFFLFSISIILTIIAFILYLFLLRILW